MDNIYTVSVASNLYEKTFWDVEAYCADKASSIAAGWFFLEYPNATGVRIASVTLQPSDDDAASTSPGYTPYFIGDDSSSAQASAYTPYGAPQASPTTGYTAYADPVAAAAGFTTTLPVAPVQETSYHQTLTNGYAPYRSFRVKLPR